MTTCKYSLGCKSQSQINKELYCAVNKLCKEQEDLQLPVESCLIVTVAGAWGDIGDTIQQIRWFNASDITTYVDVFINQNTGQTVIGVTTDNTAPCTDLVAGELPCWNLAGNETDLRTLVASGVGGVAVTDNITLTSDLDVTIPLWVLPCGEIVTGAYVLTVSDSFTAGAYQTFDNSTVGNVLFTGGSVDAVLPEWFGAVNDGLVDCTAAINQAIGSTEGIVQFTDGVYAVTGIVITKRVTLQGQGWSTIIRNSSSVNHSISRIGGADVATQAIKIADLAIDHTGSGNVVDGIHIQQVNNHLRIERVKVEFARRDGIYVEGGVASFTGSLYTRIEQCLSEGNLRDGVFINGGVNNAVIIGGRFGGNSRYGLNVDDTVTGDPASFPNTLRVFGPDLPGNTIAGLHEAGHSNAYYGLRFEGNGTQDILFATKSESAMFFGTAYSSTPVINGTPSARATMYDKNFFIRQFEDYGYLNYWDELDNVSRFAPKRSFYNINIPATSAGSGILDWAVSSSLDRAKVKSVAIIPIANITGVATDNMRLAIRKKPVVGVDVIVAFLTFSLGVNATAFTECILPISGNDTLVDGDVLYFEKNENGTGMASPILTVQVEYGGY